MTVGVGTETKPDALVMRYLGRAIGVDRRFTLARTRQLLELAAADLAVGP